MHPSTWLYGFLEHWEQLRLAAFLPTPNDVPTIGYGHTRGVRLGDTCTKAQADDYLRSDVEWAADCVNKAVTTPLNQNEYDALVSFVFNIGATAFIKSTMLHFLEGGYYALAAAEFPKWNRQHDVVLDGLTRRREAERARFLTPVEPTLVT